MKLRQTEAVRLVWPDFNWRKMRIIRSRDGVATLKRRAFIRAASLWARPINAFALGLSLILLFVGEAGAALPCIAGFGLLALVLQKGAEAPKRRRERRIIGDVRPLLLSRAVQLPETTRAGRIIRAQPRIVFPDLPPDRPRTRIAERRPGPDDAYFE
jgi:hypothetical protein